MAVTAYLSLGSNLGDRAANLNTAIERLHEAGREVARSSIYETQPVDVLNQPWFLNCIVGIETRLSARELIALALRIESEMGRLRTGNKDARKIDIDIVLFGDEMIDETGLKVPHPTMAERRFVLEPLAEIAPGLCHPGLKRTIRELVQLLPAGQVVRRL